MSQVDADLNLLFGVLALQHDLIDAQHFADACAGWAVRKDCTLGELLVERGWISPTNCELVEQWVQHKVIKHGGDVHASLGAVVSAEIRDALGKIVDPETREAFANLVPTASFILGGTTLGLPTREQRSRYTLTRLHAEGGLGKVWLAFDTELNREVALKEIQPRHAYHPEAWRRFIKEAQVTGQLEHPNIVPVYELARRAEDDQPFYTMRFVRGRTLRQAIADHYTRLASGTVDPLEFPRLLQAFISICQAIAYAHTRGVLHRDLKPANIILGDFGEVLVLDWGLAKMVDRSDEANNACDVAVTDEAQTEATRAGAQIGTPSYMAPEQAEGRVDLINARTDIYGLGAILFEILTGRAPHVGKSGVLILQKIIERDTPHARTVNPRSNPALDAICAKAMAKAAALRYATASNLAEDVQRWLADEPISALSDRWTQRLARWSRRHRTWVQAGAASLLIIVLLSIIFAVLQSHSAAHLGQALADVKRERDRANKWVSDLSLERGLKLEEVGNTEGSLWLALSLANAPAADKARQDMIRARLSAWFHQSSSLKAILPLSDTIRSTTFSPTKGKPIGQRGTARILVVPVAFSPDGKTILTRCGVKTARLWNGADGSSIGRPMVHNGLVSAVAFSPDSRTVLTGSIDKTARLWNAADGSPIGGPMTHQDAVTAVVFSPDGGTVLTGSWNTARLWNAAAGSPIGQPMTHHSSVLAVAFSPDGKTVLTGSWDTARLWNATDGSPIGQPMTHEGAVSAVAFSPDGKTILTGSHDRDARLWNFTDGMPIGRPMWHQDEVSAVAFSPDSKTVLTGSYDKTARLWNATDGSPIGQPMWHQDWVVAVAFSPDGKTILTGSQETARLWNIAAGWTTDKPLTHQDTVAAVAFSPDGKTILTGSHDHTARLWNAANGTPTGQPMKHQDRVVAVAFSPDGGTVLTGSGDKTARLWNAADGSPIGQPMRYQDTVAAVAFSPDGGTVLTGSHDHTARLWHSGVPGDPRRIVLWTQVATGMELNEEANTVQLLDAKTWQERKKQLDAMGGPPSL
jgi:WD40 repeat protein/serine/threonine protein kinase